MNNFVRHRSYKESQTINTWADISSLYNRRFSSTGHSDQEISRSGDPYGKYTSILSNRGSLYYYASFDYLKN
jgi:hypothetical protein